MIIQQRYTARGKMDRELFYSDIKQRGEDCFNTGGGRNRERMGEEGVRFVSCTRPINATREDDLTYTLYIIGATVQVNHPETDCAELVEITAKDRGEALRAKDILRSIVFNPELEGMKLVRVGK